MNKLELKGERNIAKGRLKQKRSKASDDKLQYIAGKSEELLGRIQKHTNLIREAVRASAAHRRA